MASFELPRVRTELQKLLVIPFLTPHPEQANGEFARTINITVDGCCDHTKVIADDEMLEYFTNLMRDVDTSLWA